MKITKSKLAQIVQEELSNTMTEGFGLVGALSAVKDAEDRGIADAQDDFARIQAGGKVLQIDTTEETQEEEDAYNKGWQDEMDRLKQTAADRKLNRPPPPETPEDIEAAQAEYDFESHFSEGKMKITKSKLAQIVQEELQAVTAEGYKAYKRDDMSPHAKELTKNRKKGYSPQAAVTAIPDNEEVDKAYHKSLNKKPRRGLEEAGEDTDTLESHMLGREHALAVSKGEMAMEDTYLKRMRDEAYGAGFDDAMKKLDPQSNWDDEGGSDTDDSLNPDEPEGGLDDDWMWENKITKSQLAQLVQEELAAVNLQEAPLPADEYEDTVEYLWSQNLSDIVLPFKHATSLDGEFPPAIETIVDYWEKKDFKGMASEWLDLRDELDDWLKSRGFNWSIRTEEDPGSRYVDYSIPNGKKGRMPRNVIDTNFNHAFRLIRMLIDNPPAEGYDYRGFAGMSKPGVTSARYRQDTLGRRPQQERKITKSQLAQIVQEELKATLSEAYSDTEYDPYWDEKAEEDARDEALWSAIDELLVFYEDAPVPIRELIPSAPEDFDPRDEKEWIEDGEEYLLGLVKAGDVVRVEGSPNDDWYGKEANLYVLAQ